MNPATTDTPQLSTLAMAVADGVCDIRLYRAERANALNEAMWRELRTAFQWADATGAVRVVILSGTGRNFCAGIDLAMLADVAKTVTHDHADAARGREALRRLILDLQDCLTSIERCRKPVLAAIHGACVGGAVDLIACCDMRYATADAQFSVREIDIGMTADVGSLQRLPRLMPDGIVRELAYSGRDFDGIEAQAMGLVNRVFESPEALLSGVREIAAGIAGKAPLAIRGTKEMLNYARDHSVADGLNYVATWNAAMLMSADLDEAIASLREKRKPEFGD